MWSKRFPSLLLLILACLVAQKDRRTRTVRPRRPPATRHLFPAERVTAKDPRIRRKLQTRNHCAVGPSAHLAAPFSEDTIYAAFIQRLNQQKMWEAIAIGDLKKRENAIKQARAEANRYGCPASARDR